jgi:hypothetical protein
MASGDHTAPAAASPPQASAQDAEPSGESSVVNLDAFRKK